MDHDCPLLFGGLVIPILGWLIGVMLWSSRVWATRYKLIGTLLIPGGLGGAVYVGLFAASGGQSCGSRQARPGGPFVTHCAGGPSSATTALQIALLVVVVATPIATAAYLSWRIRHTEGSELSLV